MGALFLKGIMYDRYPPLLLSMDGLGRLQAAGRLFIGFVGRMIVHDVASADFCEGWCCGLVCEAHTIAVQNRRCGIRALCVLYKRRAWGGLDPSYFWREVERKIVAWFASCLNRFWTWWVGSYVYLPYITLKYSMYPRCT